MNDDLGDRMKGYEQAEAGRRAMPLLPICIRIDGKNFSKFTTEMKRPFDEKLHEMMVITTIHLVDQAGAKVGYTQSDEISLVLLAEEGSQNIFDGKFQKLTSVLAAMASVKFNELLPYYFSHKVEKYPVFDARAWNVPTETEAINCFVWRQIDAIRNSVSMLARHHFSHKELVGKSSPEMKKMLLDKGMDWDAQEAAFRLGTFVTRNKEMRTLNTEELARIPEKHRPAPDMKVERTMIKPAQVPLLTKIMNRREVLFCGQEPVFRSEP
jgi:tRNA(His) guanylyltransferase